MPRYAKTGPTAAEPLSTLASRIKAGKVVPIISNVIGNDLVLGGHARLTAEYARLFHLGQPHDLAHLLQLKSLTDKALAKPWDLGAHYLEFVKNQLFDLAAAAGAPEETLAEVEANFDDLSPAQFCASLGYPDLDNGADNPLLLLANLPLPIYLTTGYHNFIELALRRAGKTPHSEICRWHKTLESIPAVLTKSYEPSPQEPLVYHLYGFDEYADSLVLTEDNYWEFLVAISEHRGQEADRIVGRVRQAMAESALILLGYNLRSWDFKTLFWGLIKTRPVSQPGVFVQLRPDSDEESYLEQYLSRAEFEVVWSDIASYLKKLQPG